MLLLILRCLAACRIREASSVISTVLLQFILAVEFFKVLLPPFISEVFNVFKQEWEEHTGQIHIFISNSSSSNEDFKDDEFNQISNK